MYCSFCGFSLLSEASFRNSCGKNIKFMYDANKPVTNEGNITYVFLINYRLLTFCITVMVIDQNTG